MSKGVGFPVEEKTFGSFPPTLKGRYVTLNRLESQHTAHIWQHIQGDAGLWDYMWDGPFEDEETFGASLAAKSGGEDPYSYAIIDNMTRQAVGYLAYLRTDRTHRTTEVGHVLFSKAIQRTRGATEAFYLLMKEAFDVLNVRRLEWKCNNLNEPSKRAALRLGFKFEGVFRQHLIIKGRSRDSDWYSILDSEWAVVGEALKKWLDPGNFDEQGMQRKGLVDIRNALQPSK